MPDLRHVTTAQFKALRIKEITVAQALKILFSEWKALIKISVEDHVIILNYTEHFSRKFPALI